MLYYLMKNRGRYVIFGILLIYSVFMDIIRSFWALLMIVLWG